jgi:hypothetical protein
MVGCCSTGQSPQWAVVPMEEEENDIFLIFYPNHTDTQVILTDFYSVHPKLNFTAEIEQINTLNYLDVSIHKTQNNIKTSIYRKPTVTDTTIPCTSNNPTQLNSYTTD